MQKLTEENWETELDKHPLLRTKPFESGEEIPELFQAIQAIKFEDNDKDSIIFNYKEEGDYYIKKKKFKDAVISYTKAIEMKSSDQKLNSILFSNRATANFFLENYGSCLKDADKSLLFDPKYIKSFIKAILACNKLEKYENIIRYCDNALVLLDPEEKDFQFFNNKKNEASVKMYQIENIRKVKEAREKEYHNVIVTIKTALTIRNIVVFNEDKEYSVDDIWEDFFKTNTDYPFIKSPLDVFSSRDAKQESVSYLYLEESPDSSSVLHWPVVFVYPEYKTYDFIMNFSENDSLHYHLDQMLPSKNSDINYPEWDKNKHYEVESISGFWEDKKNHKLIQIDLQSSLNKALYNTQKVFIQAPFLPFIVLSRKSNFYSNFILNYKNQIKSPDVILL